MNAGKNGAPGYGSLAEECTLGRGNAAKQAVMRGYVPFRQPTLA